MKLCSLSGNRVVKRQVHFLDNKVVHHKKSKNDKIKQNIKVSRLHDVKMIKENWGWVSKRM